jgi:2'-hydroxyisoflavone reductase
VTLFNRGLTNPELFPEVERLQGDRDGNIDALRGRTWDAVVDVAGFLPRVVRQSVELVDAPYYLFVSTISVYSDFSRPIDESSPVRGDVDSEEILENYGELKAMCERVAQERPGAIVRPALIVGPHDPTGRFTYWPHRIALGGDVLAPAPPEEPASLIDVRDLGGWMVRLCENGTPGVFNAVEQTSWGELLDACARTVNPEARLVWIPGEWLAEQGVGEWMELPVWISSDEMAGLHRAANDRAVAAGLTFRTLEDTARATLAEAQPTDDAGMKPEREAELLDAWSSLASG